MTRVTVSVELKPSVLDPQGKAIQHSLDALGFEGVEDVRVGKLFRIVLDENVPEDQIGPRVEEMCERLLANTVVESYSWTID